MTTLAEFFEREAHATLLQLRVVTAVEPPDASAVHRSARALRGSAQMAREERVYRAALALELAVKPTAVQGEPWSPLLLGGVRAAIDDLAVLIDGVEPSLELDGRLRSALERWGSVGVDLPEAVLARGGQREATDGTREFRAYAARELEGIADALDQGLRALRANPMDREALKAVLRRQRALRGAARLDEVPVIAEILHAVEDLSRVIAKLDVGVKDEWLDSYRVAREGLVAAIPSLQQDQDPPPTPALARLRHLRAELLARYGTGETINPAAGPREGLAPAFSGATAPVTSTSAMAGESPTGPAASLGSSPPAEPVPINSLEYRGQSALRRALTLRQALEDAIPADDADARELLEEVFDLIRLALE